MKEITVDLEVVTPMFLHGADGKTPELRPPSIKGVMRYWWRAAKAEDDLNKLRQEETEIFGGAGDDDAKRSSVTLNVHTKNLKLDRSIENSINNDYIGLKYLFYTFSLGDNKGCGFFDTGSTFGVTLFAKDAEKLKKATAALWLAVYFGGLGMRSRRGAGNMITLSVNELDVIEKAFDFRLDGVNSANSLKAWLEKNYHGVKSVISQGEGTKSYSNLYGARLIILTTPNRCWQKCLDEVGLKYKEFRSNYRLEQRAEMGLPITKVNIISKDEYSKSASRLFMKVIKLGNEFFSYFVCLRGDILPKGTKLEIGRNKVILTNDNIIDRFLNSIDNKLEVEL